MAMQADLARRMLKYHKNELLSFLRCLDSRIRSNYDNVDWNEIEKKFGGIVLEFFI